MDADRIKDFLIQHLEKFLLAVFVAVTGFLIYKGLDKPDFMSVKRTTPQELSQRATRVRSDIDLDHTEAVVKERIPTFDIIGTTALRDAPVVADPYSLDKTWKQIDAQSVIRRGDPVLTAPVDLRLHGVVASIAAPSRSEKNYPLAKAENADEVESEAERRRPPRRSNRGRGGADGGMDGMGMGMGMGGDMGDMDGMGMGMGDMGGMGMGMGAGMGPGGGSMGSSASRSADAFADETGFRPASESNRYPRPAIGVFIAGTALIPHEDIYRAYETALSDARAYNPTRDTPVYLDIDVQRADITGRSIDDLGDDDWTSVISYARHVYLATQLWHGFAKETVPADYRNEQITAWIPPVLLDDYTTWANHPEIPLLSVRELRSKDQMDAADDDDDDDTVVDGFDDFNKQFDVGDSGGSSEGGMGGMGDMGGMGMGDMGGMGMGDMGGMGGMGMGRGMGGVGIAAGRIEADPIDHKLIRFIDYYEPSRQDFWTPNPKSKRSPRFRRTYVYRVRYGVMDPNFPTFARLQPKMADLRPETAARVGDLVRSAEEKKSRSGLTTRFSEYSEISEPVSLPMIFDRYVAPPKEKERPRLDRYEMGSRKVEVYQKPPRVRAIASVMDPRYGARVPIPTTIKSGDWFATKAEHADVIDPLTLKVKKIESPVVPDTTTVVDIDLGDINATNDELQGPTKVLMMNSDGSLTVADSVKDQRRFRTYNYSEEKDL